MIHQSPPYKNTDSPSPTPPFNEGDANFFEAIARQGLRSWLGTSGVTYRLLRLSENATVEVESPSLHLVARIHRPNYHSANAILSELSWIQALRVETNLRVPEALSPDPEVPLIEVRFGATCYQMTCFRFISGEDLQDVGLGEAEIREIGRLTAQLHRHAQHWKYQRGFERFSWDLGSALGVTARWGTWRDNTDLSDAARRVFGSAEALVLDRLSNIAQSQEHFGLIHGDLRATNLRQDPTGQLHIMDFDDCGFGYYLYDLAGTLSFQEHREDLVQLIGAWVEGYQSLAPTPPLYRYIVDLVMMRRLMLLGWVTTHPHAYTNDDATSDFIDQSCEITSRYLMGQFIE